MLAKGRSAFQITQFAVADDEVDYGLYDPAHPLGSEYYGSAIENMPIVEAVPDETQNLRYKLVTLTRPTNVIPRLRGTPSSIILTYTTTGQIVPAEFTVGTDPSGLDGDPFGYTAILYDREAALLEGSGITGQATPVFTEAVISQNAAVVKGFRFRLFPKAVTQETPTQLVITGNQTGATVVIPVTIYPATTAQA